MYRNIQGVAGYHWFLWNYLLGYKFTANMYVSLQHFPVITIFNKLKTVISDTTTQQHQPLIADKIHDNKQKKKKKESLSA